MQCKVLLTVTFALCSVVSLKAQKHTNVTLPPRQGMVVQHDTVVVSKTVIKKYKAPVTLAANTPAATTTHTTPVIPVTVPAKADKPAQQASAPKAPAVITALAAPAQDEKGKYKPVPLAGTSYYGEMNDFVTDFVRKYFSSHNRTLNVVQGKGNTLFSLIDNVLDQHGIPKELKYLAVIESALNNNAVSRVGAVGPWQFMASTARLMGLKVSGKKDERRDYYKSTTAAAKYLTYLYDQLNDWLLVVAAYNSGPTPVQRAMKRTGSNNFWDIKPYLPRETQGHVMAFIATATIFENLGNFISAGSIPTDFNFGAGKVTAEAAALAAKEKKQESPFTPEELKSMAIVRINEPLSFELMVQELGIDKRLLKKWNADYDLFIYNTYPKEFYSLRIPKEKLDHFVEKKEYLTKRSRQIFSNQMM